MEPGRRHKRVSPPGGRAERRTKGIMSEEMKNTKDTGLGALLERLRTAPELFSLMSVCTKEPYVVCDGETYDDEVFLFFDVEEAKKERS